jgi:hypothetical protein
MDKKYSSEIGKRIKQKIEIRFGTRRAIIITITAALIINVIAYIVFRHLWGVNTANQQIFWDVITTVLLAALVFGVSLFFWRFFDIPEEIYNDQNKLLEVTQSSDLNLIVSHGSNIIENAGVGNPHIYLTIDVVNKELRKVVDLEARFVTIYQWTEKHPDDRSKSNCYLSFRSKNLQWQDRKYMINLTPGFPETKLKIAMLNCANSEFYFIHEVLTKQVPELQVNSLYKVVIEFKGRLDGDDPTYKFFHYDVEFMCLPNNCILEFLPEAESIPDIPEGLKGKLIH